MFSRLDEESKSSLNVESSRPIVHGIKEDSLETSSTVEHYFKGPQQFDIQIVNVWHKDSVNNKTHMFILSAPGSGECSDSRVRMS